MDFVPENRPPAHPDIAALRAKTDADFVVESCRALLSHPVFADGVAVQILTKMTVDPRLAAHERARCVRTLRRFEQLRVRAERLPGGLPGPRRPAEEHQ